MTVVVRAEKLTKTFGSHRGIVAVDFVVMKGAIWIPWAERGRQVNDHPSPGRPLAPDVRHHKDFRT